MNYGKEYYPNAVFASDEAYRNLVLPIKSGYYFNPLGNTPAQSKQFNIKILLIPLMSIPSW